MRGGFEHRGAVGPCGARRRAVLCRTRARLITGEFARPGCMILSTVRVVERFFRSDREMETSENASWLRVDALERVAYRRGSMVV